MNVWAAGTKVGSESKQREEALNVITTLLTTGEEVGGELSFAQGFRMALCTDFHLIVLM